MLFDTTILIAHLRGDARATAALSTQPRSERLASVLSRTEVEGGMRSGERRDVSALFGTLTLVPVSDAIARRAGEHLRSFRRSHVGIDLVDYIIGATAELHSADLATLDVKHFPMFEGLRPAY